MDTSEWNSQTLSAPSFIAVDFSKVEYENLLKTTNFQSIFYDHAKELIQLFEKYQPFLNHEKQVLTSLLYKSWNTMRNQRSIQNMKKVKSLLNKLSGLCICKLTDVIIRLFTFQNKIETKVNISLPSREIIKFYLLRLFASYRLISYGIYLIRFKIVPDLCNKIRKNIFIVNNLLFVGVVSRIYCLIRRFQISIVYLYNCLKNNVLLFKSAFEHLQTSEADFDNLPIRLKVPKMTQMDILKEVKESIRLIDLKSDDEKTDEDIGLSITRF